MSGTLTVVWGIVFFVLLLLRLLAGPSGIRGGRDAGDSWSWNDRGSSDRVSSSDGGWSWGSSDGGSSWDSSSTSDSGSSWS